MNAPYEQTPATGTVKSGLRDFRSGHRALPQGRLLDLWCGPRSRSVRVLAMGECRRLVRNASGGGVLMLLVIGGLLAFFGARIPQGRLSKAITITFVGDLVRRRSTELRLFASLSQLNNEGAGVVSVQPSVGLFVGLGGLVASVVGTVLAQTTRRTKVSVSEPVSHDN